MTSLTSLPLSHGRCRPSIWACDGEAGVLPFASSLRAVAAMARPRRTGSAPTLSRLANADSGVPLRKEHVREARAGPRGEAVPPPPGEEDEEPAGGEWGRAARRQHGLVVFDNLNQVAPSRPLARAPRDGRLAVVSQASARGGRHGSTRARTRWCPVRTPSTAFRRRATAMSKVSPGSRRTHWSRCPTGKRPGNLSAAPRKTSPSTCSGFRRAEPRRCRCSRGRRRPWMFRQWPVRGRSPQLPMSSLCGSQSNFTALAAATDTASWRRSDTPSAPTRRRTTPTARCL